MNASASAASARRDARPSLCVVVPCYDEIAVLPALAERLRAFLASWPHEARVLFVDDGSRDGTGQALVELAAADARFAVLGLSRNFGHQAAVSAGLAHARGDLVAVMDADLQDPPEVFLAMLERWREGADVVFGVRRGRKDGVLLRGTYAAFYRLLKRVAAIEIPLDAGDFSLLDRRVVDELVRLPERNRFVRGLRSWVGFRQAGVEYERAGRAGGESKYSLGRLLDLALDGLVGFSFAPLRLASWLGASAALLACGYLLWALGSMLLGRATPPGWASLVVVLVFIGGMQLIVLGIIGEYIGRIFDEVKGRPAWVVADRAGWVGGAGRDG